MEQRWSLKELYDSFESQELHKDMVSCDEALQSLNNWVEKNLTDFNCPVEKLETYINKNHGFLLLYSRLSAYAHLTLSVDTKHEQALRLIDQLEQKKADMAKASVVFRKWLNEVEGLEKLIDSSKLLKEHAFYLMEVKDNAKYMLSEKEEILIAKMKSTGSTAWEKLQGLLTSTLLVDMVIDGVKKQLPLSVVRNMADEKDGNLRKGAYEAELKAYEKIEESSAACLNGIKGEVITLAEMRGYQSPLEKTLIDSRMDQQTLNAMLAAMRESLPAFHRYYRKKAELLGHKEGLPFYDLFAPMGNVNMKFTYEEARDFIVKNFRTFSDSLADFADNAFEKRWIDAEPREGKRGGAFCSNLHVIGESRILANFTGSFSDVSTLAHELGHGYHGACLRGESLLNSGYPMPIAETASIFCETIIEKGALQVAGEEEALAILESGIMGAGQVIVDIYSRYLFEKELFERRKEGNVSVKALKEMMLKAQKEAYGDGLDPNYLHPYMWVNKVHYYYAERNFYNFPYAFGLLFAKGLYAEYLKRGTVFIEQYDQLLRVTGKKSLADVAAIMNIDIRSIDFWRASLKLVEKDIEKFISLR